MYSKISSNRSQPPDPLIAETALGAPKPSLSQASPLAFERILGLSALLTMRSTFLSDLRRYFASAISCGIGPSLASTNMTMRSDLLMPDLACRSSCASVAAFDVRSRPAVSMIVSISSRQWQCPKLISCVVPETEDVIAFRFSMRRLKRVDLPTLARPTRATIGVSFGNWFMISILSEDDQVVGVGVDCS